MAHISRVDGLRNVGINSTTRNKPNQELSCGQANIRSLPQRNLSPQPKIKAKDVAATTDRIAEKAGHISRQRSHTTRGPVRVYNTQKKVSSDGLPPVGPGLPLSRRPKVGDSMERVPEQAGNAASGSVVSGAPSAVASRKPNNTVLEFAPCLRSRVAQKKSESKAATGSATAPVRGTVSGSAGTAAPPVRPRRSVAEREAFFRRLSTPKSVVAAKKCAK
ncbi:unnamed protein product [Gongylonema pulchrum]|uniref:TPX2_importin domain-containing protein n=1 Tax=Gongylonema pulchrum TaxID=637853 RepID=A0A183EC07_9BILA|nr:unnamed protein product [Gongylonema pulchrum]